MKDQDNSSNSKETLPERRVLWKISLIGTIIILGIALIKLFLEKK
ncbi:MAG: hypothetical protein OEV78_04190 [Spirochaetia bacterium]|nr:hypothetical protein [Spirochaetia bacterium]